MIFFVSVNQSISLDRALKKEVLCTLFQVYILKIDRVMTFLGFKGFGLADAKISN